MVEITDTHSDVFFPHHVISKRVMTFDAGEYSRFKHGSKDIARKMGKDLARELIRKQLFERIKREGNGKQIVVLASPSYFIPTATYALKDYLIANINPHLIKIGCNPVEECKIWRKPNYVADYGKMSYTDRKKAIGAEQFHLDVTFLKGKHLLFLDDIKITGSHEEMIHEMITRLKLADAGCTWDFLYYAVLMGDTSPDIENYLNHAAVKTLVDLNKIIQNERFIFNTRNVKFILGSNPEECENFLNYQSHTFCETLYHEALGQAYHLADEFKQNLKTLEEKFI